MKAPDLSGGPCQEQDPEVMFPENEAPDVMAGRAFDNPDVAAAKALCRVCPMRETCLEWALASRQDYGVWGGTTGRERRAMQRKHYRTMVQAETLFEVSA